MTGHCSLLISFLTQTTGVHVYNKNHPRQDVDCDQLYKLGGSVHKINSVIFKFMEITKKKKKSLLRTTGLTKMNKLHYLVFLKPIKALLTFPNINQLSGIVPEGDAGAGRCPGNQANNPKG